MINYCLMKLCWIKIIPSEIIYTIRFKNKVVDKYYSMNLKANLCNDLIVFSSIDSKNYL